MPRNVTVTFGDGTTHVYQNVPDDATPDQVEARASQEFSKPITALDGGRQPVDSSAAAPREAASGQATIDPTEGMPLWQKILAGAGQAFASGGRGLRQAAMTAGAYGAEAQGEMTPQGRQDVIEGERAKVAEARKLDAPLLATKGGKVGNLIGNVATLLPTMAIPGANTIAGAGTIGAATGLLQPSTSAKETATNTALGGAFGAGSQAVGQKVASWAGGRIAARAAASQSDEAANAVRDATLKEARKAGYVVPPTNVNRSATAVATESLAGKYSTEAAASIRNQKVTNGLVRKELGLAENTPLTVATLKGLRSKAGEVYKAIQSAGDIATDGQYIDDLAVIGQSIDDVAKDFPDLNLSANKEISELVDGMLQDRFSSKSALELTKQLRKSASGNLSGINAADPAKRALGAAQRDAAAAVEDQLMRYLESSGKGDVARKFDDARKLIAKTYSVESALNPGTGNVVAKNLGAQLKRNKPLSDGFQTIARFSQSFPKAAAEITDSKGVSKLTAAMATGGAGAALASGNAPLAVSLAALPVASYGARNALLSRAGQSMMANPNYAPNALVTGGLNSARQFGRYALPVGLSVEASQQ